MGVKAFAWCLVGLGLGLALYGWQAWNPVAFVGLVLAVLGAVVRLTHRPRGSPSGAGRPDR
ncbi:hypothetical protein [Halomonas sp. BM-2019]|uniref:hypothetical protein n=1 Tax=Halomonas sp. BM-2019 TaxID=2811227 RepID=UPI001B3C49C4|nr:MAG: hypothetical protein J5F18_05140 [Halomonas sp. BM-2019]